MRCRYLADLWIRRQEADDVYNTRRASCFIGSGDAGSSPQALSMKLLNLRSAVALWFSSFLSSRRSWRTFFFFIVESPAEMIGQDYAWLAGGAANPISERKRLGRRGQPEYSFAKVSVKVSCVRVIATKQFRRSSCMSRLSAPFLMLW